LSDSPIAPALPAECELTVAIPAKNEECRIAAALAAFARQRTAHGTLLSRRRFEVVVLANDCADRTAELAREFAARHPSLHIHVAETNLPRDRAHVGSARRAILDAAAGRFIDAGRPGGVVATTDADTIVADDWIANTLSEMRSADAVAGHVTVGDDELEALDPGLRHLYERERAYREALASVEGRFDPILHDPFPRHSSFVGASFAVSAGTYVAAGGIPRISPLEDRGFHFALQRIDARIRHSLRVRATTSARRNSRVPGGFGSFLGDLELRARQGHTFFVDHPMQTLAEVRFRAALRARWSGAGSRQALREAREAFAIPASVWHSLLEGGLAFGDALQQLQAQSHGRRLYAAQPVEVATAFFRAL